MADKTNKSPEETKDIKDLDASDLDPNELAKAIEESVAHEDNSKSAAKSSKPEPKATPPSQDKSGNETKSQKEDEPDGNEGVSIIVKRRGGYVAPPTKSEDKLAETAGSQPLQPPSKTQKTVELPADREPETSKEDDSRKKSSAVAKPADGPGVEPPPPPAVSAAPPPPAAGTESKPAQPPAPEPPIEQPSLPAEAGEKSKSSPAPQKPTVFDTTEYHLPIKARNRHYVNSVVAWVVLLLVLAATAAYVLYRLGVIEIGDLNVLE